jgi:hypothetical protein
LILVGGEGTFHGAVFWPKRRRRRSWGCREPSIMTFTGLITPSDSTLQRIAPSMRSTGSGIPHVRTTASSLSR